MLYAYDDDDYDDNDFHDDDNGFYVFSSFQKISNTIGTRRRGTISYDDDDDTDDNDDDGGDDDDNDVLSKTFFSRITIVEVSLE